MRYNHGPSRKGPSSTRLGVFRFLFLCIFFLCVIALCTGCIYYIPFSSPPDLSTCTSLEIQYDPSTLAYFVRCSNPQNLLTPAEKNYIQSLKTFVVDDQDRINAFAKDVKLGSYRFHLWARIPYWGPVYVDCYRNKKHVAFFGVFGDHIITKDRAWFQYPWGLPNLHIIEPPEMRPFRLRARCALNLGTLYTEHFLYRSDVNAYPQSNEWCDAIVRILRSEYFIDERGIKKCSKSEEDIRRLFECPSVRERVDMEHQHARPIEPNPPMEPASLLESHYAMNPNCRPNSPPDIVLLFETKAGWSQHGGPELFTFDNHDPRGGCVLLNDGTRKFIRTQEELHQLRWK